MTKPKPRKRGPKGKPEQYRRVIRNYYGAAGLNWRKAAELAGFADGNYAFTLLRRPDFQALHEQYKLKLAVKFEVTESKIIDTWAKLAFTEPGELVELDENGKPYLEFQKMTPEIRSILSEFTVEEYQEGRGENARAVKRFKVKFVSREKALDALTRIKGMYKDKLDISAGPNVVEALMAGRKRMKVREERDATVDK